MSTYTRADLIAAVGTRAGVQPTIWECSCGCGQSVVYARTEEMLLVGALPAKMLGYIGLCTKSAVLELLSELPEHQRASCGVALEAAWSTPLSSPDPGVRDRAAHNARFYERSHSR